MKISRTVLIRLISHVCTLILSLSIQLSIGKLLSSVGWNEEVVANVSAKVNAKSGCLFSHPRNSTLWRRATFISEARHTLTSVNYREKVLDPRKRKIKKLRIKVGLYIVHCFCEETLFKAYVTFHTQDFLINTEHQFSVFKQ